MDGLRTALRHEYRRPSLIKINSVSSVWLHHNPTQKQIYFHINCQEKLVLLSKQTDDDNDNSDSYGNKEIA